MHTCSPGHFMSRDLAPLRPLVGERERPVAQRGEGEAGGVAAQHFPHLTPTLSAPRGGEGALAAGVMCACPPPHAGEGRKGVHEREDQGKDLYLLHVMRRRVEHPELKRAVCEQCAALEAEV